MDSWRGALPLGGNDRNETVAKPPQRRFRRRATPAKRGIGPGCRPTEVGGPAGRLRAEGRAHGRKWAPTAREGGAQHTDATQKPSSMINRRVPDKTHTRQPAPDWGVRTGRSAAVCPGRSSLDLKPPPTPRTAGRVSDPRTPARDKQRRVQPRCPRPDRPTLSRFVAPSPLLRASARHRRRARDGASDAGLANASQA